LRENSVLIVDDDNITLMQLVSILEPDYSIYVAKDGMTALRLAERSLPDIIILDLVMPGMNGFEIIGELKKMDKTKGIPVIFITGDSEEDNERKGLSLGAVDYIHKPFNGALLIKRIETHMAVVDAKKDMMAHKQSIDRLLAGVTDGETSSEVLKTLISDTSFLLSMDRNIRSSLLTIVDLIETAIKSEDIFNIKQCLGEADVETRMILKILDGTLTT